MRPFEPRPMADPRVRILIVEDSTADAELLADMLTDELEGCTLVRVTHVAQALPCLGDVDVVVTDLSLPDAVELGALSVIRAARPDVPVVVMTGRNDRALALQALADGADDYLVKGGHDARGVATAILYAWQRRRVTEAVDHYQRIALNLLDAMESITCAVDGRGEIIAVNRAWHDISRRGDGDPARTGVGVNYFDVCRAAASTGEVGAAEVGHGLEQVLTGAMSRFEYTYPCPAPGEDRWFSLRINPLPETSGAVLTHVDISEAKRAELALVHQSLHDALTDLPNRTLLGDRLEHALVIAGQEHCRVALAFLDLDQFKRINDSLGHRAGDELLRAVSRRLIEQTRVGDTVSRFAGDEFVVLWPGVKSDRQARLLAQRLTTAFEAPFDLHGTTVSMTASIGVALGAPMQTADELLMAADAAMYAAKGRTGGGVRIYTDDLRDTVNERIRIEMELREALDRDELVLHYQPVMDLRRGAVSGVEALVRWEHPDGRRMPDTFIPVAEATGLIIPLGDWVLREACTQGARWAADGSDLVMAVNLSARQVAHPGMLDALDDALLRSGLPADRLLVEVTETTVMEDAEVAELALQAIADRGVGIAIDDFGTGYSSLVYLKRYPIDALKIDRSFVDGMGSNPDDDAIVASIISLARAVGADCIAEGVETVEQLAALRSLGCGLAQGYLFARPLPATQLLSALADCTRLLAERPPTTVPSTVSLAVLERIQELHRSGASLHTIAAALNREGAPSPSGARWHRATVSRFLQAQEMCVDRD